MKAPIWVIMLISALTDFIITGGGTLMGAILESGNKALPSNGVILLACLAGLVASGKEVKSMLKLTDAPSPLPIK